MIQISIIVPIYNVEKCLRRCIDSILNQTFKDFELILVNDGSTDNCENICNEFMLKDTRVKYIYQRNKGVSEARNIGIENSSGKYIQFIDADDYVDENFLEIAINRLKNDNSDIVFFGFYYEYIDGTIYKERYYNKSINSKNVRYYCLDLHKEDLFGYTCCKMFKSSIIKKFNLKFNKYMSFGEDELFTCEYSKYVETISIENRPLYHYINYKGMRENLSSRKCDEIFRKDILFNAWSELLNNYDEKYIENKAYELIKFLYFNEIWSNKPYKLRKNNIDKIKKTYIMKYISNNSNLNKKILIKCIIFENIIVFKLIFKILNKLNIDI